MTGAMRVDATGLRHAEPVIGAVASGVRQALDELAASLDGEGVCWGHDRIGQQFSDVYAAPAGTTRDSFVALHDGLCAVAGAVLRVADEVDAVEDRVRLRLR
jgi:hypothetical protein